MKKILAALTALCLLISIAAFGASAEQADPTLGLKWGMSVEETAAILGVTDIETAYYPSGENFGYLFTDHTLFGRETYLTAFAFLDSELVMFGYEEIEGTFDDVYFALCDIYGPSPSYDTADFVLMAEKLFGYDRSQLDIVNYNSWYLDDGTCIALTTMGEDVHLYYFDLSAFADEPAADVEVDTSLFPWGGNKDEVYAAYNMTDADCEYYELEGGISLAILPISDYEEEIYIFANGRLVALVYDYFGDDGAANFEENIESISSGLCELSPGGAERTFEIMSILTPDAFTSPDEFVSCTSGTVSDGSFATLYYYSEDNFMFMVVCEEILFAECK